MMEKEKRHETCFMNETCLKDDICPMALVQKLLSGKRKIMILSYLSNKVLRFNDIKRRLPDVTQKMLTKQLRSLEEDHLIYRHVYPVIPPKVEYGLTELGKRIIPILQMMHEFGAIYIEETQLEEMSKEEEEKEVKEEIEETKIEEKK